MSDAFLVLHGWGGNKPDHWQEHIVKDLLAEGETVYYPKFTDPGAPNLEIWLDELERVVADIPEDDSITVLAHSLGCILWLHYAAAAVDSEPPVRADRVLLVAPPYRKSAPEEAPPGVATFYPPPLSPEGLKTVAGETVIVASDNDDFATYDQALDYAEKLEVPIEKLAGAGHISPYYGYGKWPWVFEWALKRADLPPLPNN